MDPTLSPFTFGGMGMGAADPWSGRGCWSDPDRGRSCCAICLWPYALPQDA
jgi:hypothetical protein